MPLSAEDIATLDRATDRVVALELNTGEQFFAEIVMVVDQPPTPDVFVLRVDRQPDGSFTLPAGKDEKQAGESILLADIARIALLPGIAYD